MPPHAPTADRTTLLDLPILGPVAQLLDSVDDRHRPALWTLLGLAVVLGVLLGRRHAPDPVHPGFLRLRHAFDPQNDGERAVTRLLQAHFTSPDHHLMNHVTLRMDDGTTQVDHILVTRCGVFVIETKDYGGWIFGKAGDARWTQVTRRAKHRFQNPLRQNHRHVLAVRALLDFLPADAIVPVVVFTGSGEFRTEMPSGVMTIDDLAAYIVGFTTPIMTRNRLQFCVGRLETARLAISRETDVEHVRNVSRRLGLAS
jgi:hypothetical protein